MKPDFEPGKWFMQCVGVDIAKSTFTACLCMYEFDMGCSTNPVVFNNNKTGFNQFVKWSRKEALKGMGFMTVVTILAETNGFALITNRKQLTRYAGLDVPAHQSGPVDPKRHISKQGNVHIRTALYFPAIVSTQYNPQMKDFYGRLCARKTQSKMIGVTAAMRKLLLLIYSLWKSGEEYDPERDMPVSSKKKKEAETPEGQPHGIDVGT